MFADVLIINKITTNKTVLIRFLTNTKKFTNNTKI